MKKLLISGVLLLLLVALSSCRSNKDVVQVDSSGIPTWVTNPPDDTKDFLFTSASFASSRRELAQRQATVLANTNMAQKLGIKLEALEKLFLEEVGSGSQTNYSSGFTLATQQITSQQLRGVTPETVYFARNDEGLIESFVLVKMPVGDARATLENALSRDEELFVRFKESQAFKELQENLDRLGIE